jgi:hypothetical protein
LWKSAIPDTTVTIAKRNEKHVTSIKIVEKSGVCRVIDIGGVSDCHMRSHGHAHTTSDQYAPYIYPVVPSF